MEFKFNIDDGVCEAEVEGELTIYHANDFRKELEKAIKKAGSFRLDLSGVSEMDTSCFQLLMQAQNACHENDKAFKLTAVSPAVQEVIEIFGMGQHFVGYNSNAATL